MPNVYILKQFAMSLNILCSDVKRMLVKCRCSNEKTNYFQLCKFSIPSAILCEILN